MEKLLELIEKLKETKGMRIFKRGFEKAAKLLERGEENGVFVWAPRLRYWLKDPDYISWLGTNLFLNPYASKSLYGKIFRIRKGLSRE